jgi:ABC-type uncharacterized transport system substrate-binding protein
MRRREFLTLIGGVAAAWPLAARAQQQAMPVIGFLDGQSFDLHLMTAFRQALKDAGYIEGRNVAIYFRSADGQTDRLVTLAGDIIGRRVAVIITTGGGAAALAAYAATTTIPIVFVNGVDPVSSGLVMSLNRPGGNATGVLNIASELTAKRLEVVRELAPAATVIGALRNPDYPEAEAQVREIEAAARRIGLALHLATASRESDFTPALAGLMWHRPGALLIANDPFFAAHRKRLTALVADHRVPAIYSQREYAEAGGLMSYGTNFADLYRQVGAYTGRILKGEKPADLPVMQPTRFELVINLKTAKALGLEIPPTLLARADEVIE